MDGTLIILVLLVLMYVVIFLPRQRQVARQKAMQSALAVGDEVVTIGGIHASVVGLGDDDVVLEVSPGVEVRFVREAVARRLASEAAASASEVLETVEPETVERSGVDDTDAAEDPHDGPGYGRAAS